MLTIRNRLISLSSCIQIRLNSTLTNEQAMKHRAKLFNEEKERQVNKH
jgi:hypothetical protein